VAHSELKRYVVAMTTVFSITAVDRKEAHALVSGRLANLRDDLNLTSLNVRLDDFVTVLISEEAQ
jgi:hypothetical protein